MKTSHDETETYLGDGLYAQWDGYYIRLRAPREEGDHVVFLDPPTLEAFAVFLRAVTNRVRKEGKDG